jgi:tetratricopeptide (TPR) repeat protein
MSAESPKQDVRKLYDRMLKAWKAGESGYALELSRDILQAFPDYNLGRLLQGIILFEIARYEEAEQVLHEAIQGMKLEHLHHGYTQLGHMFRERGDCDNAEKWYRKAVELVPDDATRNIFLGALLAQKGDFAGAEAAHRKATKASKGCVEEAYLNLRLVLRAQERYEEALEAFNHALKLSPDYKEALIGKADMEKTLAYLREINEGTG